MFIEEQTCFGFFLVLPYFPAHMTHRDFFVGNFRKKIMNVF